MTTTSYPADFCPTRPTDMLALVGLLGQRNALVSRRSCRFCAPVLLSRAPPFHSIRTSIVDIVDSRDSDRKDFVPLASPPSGGGPFLALRASSLP
jgi:hypothetical protein